MFSSDCGGLEILIFDMIFVFILLCLSLQALNLCENLIIKVKNRADISVI